MAENYKHLYEQTKEMLTMYQDNLIPGFRQKIDELEADNERLRKGWAEAISAYSKANSLVPRWIPVSERLPEDNLPRFSNVKQIKVLTALISDKGVRTVRSQMRYKDTWATGHDRWRWKYSGSEITHWMPLPEPPKEDTVKP